MTFDVGKPRKVRTFSPTHSTCVGNFSHITSQFREAFLRSKFSSFFYHIFVVYQASCYFAAVEVDAKNITGSVVILNNRTSSAYSDVQYHLHER